MKKRLNALKGRLTTYGNTIGLKLTLGKDNNGYFITCDDNPIALTSGRTYKELVAYVDGFRDMLLFHVYPKK